MPTIETSRGCIIKSPSPLMSKWPAASVVINNRQKRGPRRCLTKHGPMPPVQAQRENAIDTICSGKPTRNDAPFARRVGIRPPSNVQATDSKNGMVLSDRYLDRYQELAMECKERSAQLAQIEAERQWQLEEMAKFSEHVKAKSDYLHALARQISGALAEELRQNKYLRETAAQRR
ncbi:hypothetical protein TRSC58_05102 [Trypanosoma rangeli SC58]|uniref:Uncharacterized protein n=1 Tax=Trypanosoma rangeli SC58 TaxID=429131 RepID=A0A061IX05_TRYRA|nr:hypothetical protein TRSC58_05102 [Trypanosoma rangeli SC58]